MVRADYGAKSLCTGQEWPAQSVAQGIDQRTENALDLPVFDWAVLV